MKKIYLIRKITKFCLQMLSLGDTVSIQTSPILFCQNSHSPDPWLEGRRFGSHIFIFWLSQLVLPHHRCRTGKSRDFLKLITSSLFLRIWADFLLLQITPSPLLKNCHRQGCLFSFSGKGSQHIFRWTLDPSIDFVIWALCSDSKTLLTYLLINGHIPSNLPFRCQSRWG